MDKRGLRSQPCEECPLRHRAPIQNGWGRQGYRVGMGRGPNPGLPEATAALFT